MRTIEEIRAAIEDVETQRRELHEEIGNEQITDDQAARWADLDHDEQELRDELSAAEEREERLEKIRASRQRWGSTNVKPNATAFGSLSDRSGAKALIDANLRAVEGRIGDAANQAHYEQILRRHAGDGQWAYQVLARAQETYMSAWSKMMVGRSELLSNEERAAIAVGTNTQGGYLVPTHLDPTLILTNTGSSNVIRGLSRVVTLTGGANTWHGVTTAGCTGSWDAELAEVSDDSPSVGTVSIPVFSAKSLIAASIEAFEDISGLTSDVMMLFADERDRLEGAAHATGNGTTAPKGIVTALDASTGVEITSTTAATIGEVDLQALYRGVGVRWRGRSTWLMNPLYSLAIKALGTAVSASFSGDLTMPVSDRIYGRPQVESDDMPSTQTTTALDNEVIFGDFSNYIIVDKPGSTSIEYIPHLFNTANNLPDGRRAWYMHFRSGADSGNIAAFRILQDKTSA